MENIKKQSVELLQQLVRIPSLSGDEQAVAQAVEKKLKDLKFDEVWVDNLGSVIGVRKGAEPGAHIVFDAHMDVVQMGQRDAWQHEPFGGELSDGKVWGRGSTDTKGSLAGMIMALGSLDRGDIHGTVSLVASVGEEVFEGVGLKNALTQLKPDGVVVGEPTQCRLGTGQKGRAKFWLRATGKPAHSSTPEQGENAVYKAANLIERIRQLPPNSSEIMGKGVVELIDVISEPYPSTSMVPYACLLHYDRRLVENEKPEEILATYQKNLQDIKGWEVDFELIEFQAYTGSKVSQPDFHPAWYWPEETEWVRLAQQALVESRLDPTPFVAPYCTNGSTSAGEMGISSLIFGPSTIHLAHVVDEYIEVDEYLRGMRGFANLAKKLGNFRQIG